MENRILLHFEDLTFGTTYEFLEVGKNDKELDDIAKKHNLVIPSPDIAIFKGRYALADKFNRNGCRLPLKEVEKALATLTGKNVDSDHERQRNYGWWLEAHLADREIISYGIFWKSAFGNEYEDIKKKMQNGKVKISFEAWGNREKYSNGLYDLTNIHFAGGALLEKTEPAFQEAEVLEFASVIDKNIEEANFLCECLNCGHTIETNKHCNEVKCPKCNGDMRRKDRPGKGQPVSKSKKEGGQSEMDLAEIMEQEKIVDEELEQAITDFEGLDEYVEEAKRLSYEERKALPDSQFAVVKEVKKKRGEGTRKIRMFPIHDKAHVRNALARLGQAKVKQTLKKLGVSVESVEKKILKRAKELKMEDLLKKREKAEKAIEEAKTLEELEKVEIVEGFDEESKKALAEKKSIKEKELKKASEEESEDEKKFTEAEVQERINEALKDAKEKLEEAKKEKEKLEEEYKQKIEEAKKNAVDVANRRNELGDFAKDMTDEDIMDELKFENAKLKKEIAELKKGKKEKGSEEDDDMVTGSKDKETEEEETKKRIETARKNVDKEVERLRKRK